MLASDAGFDALQAQIDSLATSGDNDLFALIATQISSHNVPQRAGANGTLEDVCRTAGITSADYADLVARDTFNPSELPTLFALATAANIEITFTPTDVS